MGHRGRDGNAKIGTQLLRCGQWRELGKPSNVPERATESSFVRDGPATEAAAATGPATDGPEEPAPVAASPIPRLTNSIDTVLTGWQAACMTYGIESHLTR
ncbi:hypothetical protein [Streptomyces sp. BHT-5-2]|uniref:hypothetical protein n=1 Tax=Streptomyces sp. BHT-5-2 TaxID=2866715 RepID=UPI0021B14BEB|nr:hypothetical protein [Streptomyces sp. BHT-5-2]